jgi:hypothetical protein
MSDIMVSQSGILARRASFSSETALKLDPETTFDEWQEIGVFIGRVNRMSGWWIADWVSFGERAFGETYAQALNETGLAYQTLANYVSVGHRVPPSVRRGDLSFSHHAEVASLPPADQGELLERAASERLTKHELRYLVREKRDLILPPVPTEPNPRPRCPACAFEGEEADFWQHVTRGG